MGRLLNRARGYLQIRVKGGSPERFINLCGNRNLYLWDIHKSGEDYDMCIFLRDFYQVRPIARKTGVRVAILERNGLPFFLPFLRKRWVFLLGVILAVGFWILSSFFIWKIEAYGNIQITKDQLGEYLKSQGITLGMSKKDLDLMALEKSLRKDFTQITWTCVKLNGTRLEIWIKENDRPGMIMLQEDPVAGTDLISEFDGTVVSIIVRKGVPKVKIGDQVKKGQVLIEGRVPIYGEDQSVKEYLPVISDGDVILEHTRIYEECIPVTYVSKEKTGRQRLSYDITVGDKNWKFPNKKTFYLYSSMQEEVLPEFFRSLNLPVAIRKSTDQEYQKIRKKYTAEEIKEIFRTKLQNFLSSFAEKGIQIIEKNVNIESEGDYYLLIGEFLVQEKTGISRRTEESSEGQ